MKRRVKKAPLGPSFTVHLFDGSAELVTMDDPSADPSKAAGAFARLRPPADQAQADTSAWRARVAAVALAVRVMPTERAVMVPAASARAGERPRTFREEATALATADGDPELHALVVEILDAAGA